MAAPTTKDHSAPLKLLEREPNWIQVNNTLIPMIYRHHRSYIPLNVLQYSAGIFNDLDRHDCHPHLKIEQTTGAERMRLNEICADAGLDFPSFPKSTRLVSLDEIRSSVLKEHFVREVNDKSPFHQVAHVSEKHPLPQASNGELLDLSVGASSVTEGFKLRCKNGDGSHPKSSKKCNPSQPRVPSRSTCWKVDKPDASPKGHRSTPPEDQLQKTSSAVPTSSTFSARTVTENLNLPHADIKLTLVKFFGKSIPCIVHGIEVFTSTDSLHKIFFNSVGTVDDLDNVLRQVVKVPVVCFNDIVSLVTRPASPSMSKESLSYVKLKDVADKMDHLQCFLTGDTKKGKSVKKNDVQMCDLSSSAPLPLDLSQGKHVSTSKEHNVQTTSSPVISERGSVVAHSSSDNPSRLERAVRKKRRLENTIFKLVHDKHSKVS